MHLKSWVPIVNGLHGGPILGALGKKIYFQVVCSLETLTQIRQPLPRGWGVGRALHAYWIFYSKRVNTRNLQGGAVAEWSKVLQL